MKNKQENAEAEQISLYVQFLKASKQITQGEIAQELNVTSNTISNLVKLEGKTTRWSFSYKEPENGKKKFTRADFIKKIETHHGLSLDEKGQPKMQDVPHSNPNLKIHHFIYHHLENNPNGLPSFKQSLLTITIQGKNSTAELHLQKAKQFTVKYNGSASFLPNSLRLNLTKAHATHNTHGAVVFIQLDSAKLDNHILYGSYQGSRLSFGLVVLEKIEQDLASLHLEKRQIPPVIAWDLLNQHLNQDGHYAPLSTIPHHPQYALLETISQNFGVYEGVSLVPTFVDLNHFIFEIRPDFTVRYSSLTMKHLDGIARPYEHNLFYIQLRYNNSP